MGKIKDMGIILKIIFIAACIYLAKYLLELLDEERSPLDVDKNHNPIKREVQKIHYGS